MQLDFSWPVQSTAFQIVSVSDRKSSGATLLRAQGADGVDVVVKTNDDWNLDDAVGAHHALAALHDIIDGADIERGGAMPPLGWAPDPPMVVTGYVESHELRSAVKTETDIDLLIGPLETAGRMLAAFHEHHRATDSQSTDAAHQDAISTARKIPNGERTLDRLLARAPIVVAKSYIDITPSNVLCASSGEILLIDPPPSLRPAIIERDLGTFLFELRKQRAAFSRSSREPTDFPHLKEAFLNGYGVSDPRDPSTQALLSLFEFRRAIGTSRKRLRGRSPEAVRYAVEAGRRMSGFLFPNHFPD